MRDLSHMSGLLPARRLFTPRHGASYTLSCELTNTVLPSYSPLTYHRSMPCSSRCHDLVLYVELTVWRPPLAPRQVPVPLRQHTVAQLRSGWLVSIIEQLGQVVLSSTAHSTLPTACYTLPPTGGCTPYRRTVCHPCLPSWGARLPICPACTPSHCIPTTSGVALLLQPAGGACTRGDHRGHSPRHQALRQCSRGHSGRPPPPSPPGAPT